MLYTSVHSYFRHPTTGCAPGSWNQVGGSGDFFKTYQRFFLPAMMRRCDGALAKNYSDAIPNPRGKHASSSV